ncbi:8-oxoguanine glycosylase ogg1 [Mycoemilia scoparia]|uniref:N-glycosylase/DNA lyase n=1 Tax=Mycoemilia scoparia TaxID=417184 RepID=A0A9W8DS72_9FUNG|nr:8-oxoguanine glycosylase ogg1 [Mycoemilia scoparia]
MTISAALSKWHDLNVSPDELRLFPTLICGQAFRWRQTGKDEWSCSLWDQVVQLKQTSTTVLFRGHGQIEGAKHASGIDGTTNATDAETLRERLVDYFQLKTPLAVLYQQWSKCDDHFKNKVAGGKYKGLRLMRQDPVENLFTFICTSNNHISRITKMVHNICVEFGKSIPTGPEVEGKVGKFHTFPTIESLGAEGVEDKLRSLGFGYRAKYISQSAKKLMADHGPRPEEWLMSLRDKDYTEVKRSLMTLSGVGPKVADCICVMSLDKTQAVAIDTHIWQIAKRDYAKVAAKKALTSSKENRELLESAIKIINSAKAVTPKAYEAVQLLFTTVFGPFCGWALGVLFAADLKSLNEKLVQSIDDNNSSSNELTKNGAKGDIKKRARSASKDTADAIDVKQEDDSIVRRRSKRIKSAKK